MNAETKSVAIVTGASQGIGLAISEELLKNEYKVCLLDVNALKGQKERQRLEQKYGKNNVVFITCDVSKESQLDSTFAEVLRIFKRIDVLVNNAAVLCEDDIDKTVDINLKGVMLGCKVAFKYMGKDKGGHGGQVVNTASVAGLLPSIFAPIYSATKHGVVGLTRSYGDAYYFDKSGIIFNALCPAYVLTDLQAPYQKLVPESFGDLLQRPDMMDPSYVAQGVTQLLKEKQNGATLVVSKFEGFRYIGLSEELQKLLVSLF